MRPDEHMVVAKRCVEALERRICWHAIKRQYPEITETEINHLIRQFGLVERIQKMEPGQSISMTIYRSGESSWGDFVGIRIEDPNAIPATPPEPQGRNGENITSPIPPVTPPSSS